MEKYEIHNREKMLKAMAVCAGPDCGVQCPYHGKGVGTKTCRTLLLEDAMAALAKDKNDLDDLEAAANTYRDERDKLREGWHDLCDEREGLKEYALALEKEGQEARADRDKLKQEITCYIQQWEQAEADLHAVREQNKALIEARDALVRKASDMNSQNDELRKECDMTVVRCQVLQNEINFLMRKIGKQEGKTDRPSVEDKELMQEVGKLIGQAKYQEGRADALAEIVARCSFGGGCRHE